MKQLLANAILATPLVLLPATTLRAAVDCDNWHSLQWFFQVASSAETRNCIEYGVDVNIRNGNDWTPLHYAIVHSDPSVLMALVKADANLEAQTDIGLTPLHMAAGFDVVPTMTNILLDAGANPNSRDHQGRTPLHLAAGLGKQVHVAKALLTARADLTAQDENGRTPLHTAAWHATLPVVQTILDAEPDLEARDSSGYTRLCTWRPLLEYLPTSMLCCVLEPT